MKATVHKLPIKTRLRPVKGGKYWDVYADMLTDAWLFYRVVKRDTEKASVLFKYVMTIQQDGVTRVRVPEEVAKMIDPDDSQRDELVAFIQDDSNHG